MNEWMNDRVIKWTTMLREGLMKEEISQKELKSFYPSDVLIYWHEQFVG